MKHKARDQASKTRALWQRTARSMGRVVGSEMAIDSLMVGMGLLHLVASPHTKVEESFNLQAAHDMMVYGRTGVAQGAYDHFVFAGAVPRSFVGAALLAGVAKPLVWATGFQHAQFVVRGLLAAANAASLVLLRRALLRAAGAPAATWCGLLMLGQFHVWYYLSRTLPNMLAFGPTTAAFALLLQPGPAAPRRALALLALAAAVLRAELALLLAATGLYLLARRALSLRALARVVVVATALALALSLPLDSYLWQRPLWPELAAFYFNALLGSASRWGIQPWHYYLTSALPRLLLNPLLLPLAVLALRHPATRRTALPLLVPSLLYLALYSLQPHKETRFVLYLVPPLTAVAALGAARITARRSNLAMLALSSLNYPGGDALAQLRALARHQSPAPPRPLRNPDGLPLALLSAHAQQPFLLFDRTEDPAQLAQPAFWLDFDYALAEHLRFLGPDTPDEPLHHHRLLGRGAHVASLRRALRPWTGGWWLGPRMTPRIHILKRRPESSAAAAL
ncbi:hypothetical protein CDD81_2245 [Ophiocordyceps australis]|uniref:Mannosyltransferase n=1 Tax=Ophiocordyceps australis TaxID=1399860 RepID=A0A2C5Y7K1_9HYPO|nr:hypothetical protein CDD81_2245 [Ophiocordyceps australis]